MAGISATAFAVLALAVADLSIGDARWAHPGADLFRLLSATPGECLGPVDPQDAHEVNVGAVAFRSPLLFGGLAARTGLSCNSCHRDGHDNREFHLEGLSGAPGTADVTSSIFSKTREDGVFNPVAIPSLVDSGVKSSFGTRAAHPSIDAFVADAVAEEFQGDAPAALIAALSAYVKRLRREYCPPRGLGVNSDLELKYPRVALETALEAIRRGDPATADFMFASSRLLLQRVHERFDGADLEAERASIASLSRSIGDLRASAAADPEAAMTLAPDILRQFGKAQIMLRKSSPKSLYDRDRLRRYLESAQGVPN